jgi:hypothetical protein
MPQARNTAFQDYRNARHTHSRISATTYCIKTAIADYRNGTMRDCRMFTMLYVVAASMAIEIADGGTFCQASSL